MTGGLYFKYVRKTGGTSKVYVSPGGRMDKYMLPEDADPMTKNIFGETLDKDIFSHNDMDEIPCGVDNDSTNENYFGLEPPTTAEEVAYASEPPKPPNTNADANANASENAHANENANENAMDNYKQGQEPSV